MLFNRKDTDYILPKLFEKPGLLKTHLGQCNTNVCAHYHFIEWPFHIWKTKTNFHIVFNVLIVQESNLHVKHQSRFNTNNEESDCIGSVRLCIHYIVGRLLRTGTSIFILTFSYRPFRKEPGISANITCRSQAVVLFQHTKQLYWTLQSQSPSKQWRPYRQQFLIQLLVDDWITRMSDWEPLLGALPLPSAKQSDTKLIVIHSSDSSKMSFCCRKEEISKPIPLFHKL